MIWSRFTLASQPPGRSRCPGVRTGSASAGAASVSIMKVYIILGFMKASRSFVENIFLDDFLTLEK